MRLKWIALTLFLGFIVILDPTQTPAQYGGGGDKGGFGKGGFGKGGFGKGEFGKGGFGKGEFGGTPGMTPGGFPTAGATLTLTAPTPGAFPTQGSNPQPPGGGFPQRGGDRGGFGGGNPNGGTGGRPPGGGGGGMNPEQAWGMLLNLTKSTGDSVDLGAIPPDVRDMMRRMTERSGGIPLPDSGILTKAAFLDHNARSEVARAAFRASGMAGGQPGGRDFGGRDFGGRDFNRGDPDDPKEGDTERGNGKDRKKEAEEPKPVAMRYGKLPKDLPEWFDTYDVDKDGQVALWEWRKVAIPAGHTSAEFHEMDLNGDGLITADELLRFLRLKDEDAKVAAILSGEGSPRPSGRGPGGRPSDKGGDKAAGDKDADKTASDKDKGPAKPNPFQMGGRPPDRKGKN